MCKHRPPSLMKTTVIMPLLCRSEEEVTPAKSRPDIACLPSGRLTQTNWSHGTYRVPTSYTFIVRPILLTCKQIYEEFMALIFLWMLQSTCRERHQQRIAIYWYFSAPSFSLTQHIPTAMILSGVTMKFRITVTLVTECPCVELRLGSL